MDPPGKEDTIQVVEAPQKAKDVLAYGSDELERLLLDLLDAGVAIVADAADRQTNLQGIREIVKLAADLNRRYTEDPLPNGIPLLAVRQALYNTGVLLFGENNSARPAAGRHGDANALDMARPPYPKELWQVTPPLHAAGFSIGGWAVSAAAEDRVEPDGLIVIPEALGRRGVGLGDLALRSQAARLTIGVVPGGLFAMAGEMLRVSRPRHDQRVAVASKVSLQLTDIVNHAASFFRRFPGALETYPKLGEGRLGKRAYTLRRGVLSADSALVVVDPFEKHGGRDLNVALEAFNTFARSAAASRFMLLSYPSLQYVPQPSTGMRDLIVSVDTPMVAPVSYPLCPETTTDNLNAKKRRMVDAAEKQYHTVLAHLASEILRIRGEKKGYRPAQPLNYTSEILAAEGLNALRDLIYDTDESQERVKAYLTNLEEEQVTRRIRHELEAASEAHSIRARQYLIIIEQKLGAARLDLVVRHLQSSRMDIDNPSEVLKAVRASAGRGKDADTAVAVVVTEYENLTRQWDLRADNKCPHLDLVRKLGSAIPMFQRQKLLTRLYEFLGKVDRQKVDSGWLSCRSCNFRAICPHALRRYELELRQASYAEMQKAMQPYIRQVTVDARNGVSESGYAFYCKVCGEKLFERFGNEFEIENVERMGDFDDDLKRFLWKSMMQIIDPSRGVPPIVRFDRPVNPARFAAEASDICHPLVLSVRSTPRFPPGSEQREMWKELLAVIYLYAYLFSLALGVPPKTQNVKLADIVRVELYMPGQNQKSGAKQKPAPDEIAQTLLVHLVRAQSYSISKLESVSNQQIGNQFRDAYRHIQDTHGRLLITQQDSAAMMLTNLTYLDPYFAVLVKAYEISTGASLWAKHTPTSAAALFSRIMGSSISDILASKPPAEYGPFVRSMLSRKGGIEFPSGVKPEWVYHIPELNLFHNAWGIQQAKAYWKQHEHDDSSTVAQFAWFGGRQAPNKKRDSVRTRSNDSIRATNPTYWDAVSGIRATNPTYWDAVYLLIMYSLVCDDDSYERYSHLLNIAQRREFLARQDTVYELLIPRNNYLDATRTAPPPTFDQVKNTPLSHLYDENGERHMWTTFLWVPEDTAGGVEELKLTKRQIQSMLDEARENGQPSPLRGHRLADWVCTTCGVHRSAVDQLDEAKVRKRLDARERLYTFFMYYESRCPVKGMHEFVVGDAKIEPRCSKCGVSSGLLTTAGRQFSLGSKGWEDAFAYYSKFENEFDRIRGANAKENRDNITRASATAALAETVSAPKLPARDFNSVLAFAKLLDPKNPSTMLIESMGGTEGFTIEEIRDGKRAAPPTHIDDPRLTAANGNIRELLSRYCQLYFQARRDGKSEGLPSPSTLGMDVRFFTPYRAAVAHARLSDQESEWAVAILGYSIDAFAKLAVELHAQCSHSEEMQKHALDIARDIIYCEGLFTVPGDFQWSVFGDDDNARGASAADSSGDDARRYDGPTVGAEDEIARNERDYANQVEGTENPFAYEGVDIDKSLIAANLDN